MDCGCKSGSLRASWGHNNRIKLFVRCGVAAWPSISDADSKYLINVGRAKGGKQVCSERETLAVICSCSENGLMVSGRTHNDGLAAVLAALAGTVAVAGAGKSVRLTVWAWPPREDIYVYTLARRTTLVFVERLHAVLTAQRWLSARGQVVAAVCSYECDATVSALECVFICVFT